MRLRFNGVVERRSSGCPVCGHAKITSVFVADKSYYLPSGRHMLFRKGQEYEVGDRDAKFLLSYKYETGKEIKHAFEVVE